MSLAPPIGLLAELTHRCPLRCLYCSNPLELAGASRELPTGTWLRVFREAAELGVLQLHLSGGEPAARRDLEDLVAGAASQGLYTNLITSGVSLPAERLQRLKAAGLDHVQLSLQGASAQTAERIGGMAGAHGRKAAFAEAVRAAGLPLTINAVVHRLNLHEVEAIIGLAEAMGAGRLEIAHAQYYGWALANRDALLPDRAMVDGATAVVRAAAERLKGRLSIDYVLPDYLTGRPKACMGGWGRAFMVVTPAGQVLPCHAAQSIPGLAAPHVDEAGLRDIWARAPLFQRFRGTDWMPEPCRGCDRRELDWGGCRCQALALTGDAAAADPACRLAPGHGVMADAVARAGKEDAALRYRGAGVEKVHVA